MAKQKSSIIKNQVPGGWEIRGYTSPIKDALLEGGAVWQPDKVRWFYAGDFLPGVIRDAMRGLSKLPMAEDTHITPQAPKTAETTPPGIPLSKAPEAPETPPKAPESGGNFADSNTGVLPRKVSAQSRYTPNTGRITPLRQQYLDIKAQYPDAILFFRLGDFYEMFDQDAETASEELDLVLTSRPVNRKDRIPMCGVPHHTIETYVARLIEKGYHVAVCEQKSEPDGRGLVERAVTRVVTPEHHDHMAAVVEAVLS